MPQASVPHRVPARNRGSTRFPARARGRGQAAGSLFPQSKRSGGGKGSAPPLPAQPAPRATAEPAAREGDLGASPGRRGRPEQSPGRRRTEGASGPREGPVPTPAAPGRGRTWGDSAGAPAPAARSPQRSCRLGVPAGTLTLTRTHTRPAEAARDPAPRARTPSGTAHPRPRPAPRPPPGHAGRRSTHLSRQRRCGVRSSGGLGWRQRSRAAAAAEARTEPAGRGRGRARRRIGAETLSSPEPRNRGSRGARDRRRGQSLAPSGPAPPGVWAAVGGALPGAGGTTCSLASPRRVAEPEGRDRLGVMQRSLRRLRNTHPNP